MPVERIGKTPGVTVRDLVSARWWIACEDPSLDDLGVRVVWWDKLSEDSCYVSFHHFTACGSSTHGDVPIEELLGAPCMRMSREECPRENNVVPKMSGLLGLAAWNIV